MPLLWFGRFAEKASSFRLSCGPCLLYTSLRRRALRRARPPGGLQLPLGRGLPHLYPRRARPVIESCGSAVKRQIARRFPKPEAPGVLFPAADRRKAQQVPEKGRSAPYFSSAASHSAGLKPTSTVSPSTTIGRLTSMPSAASRRSCSASGMSGRRSFRFIDL